MQRSAGDHRRKTDASDRLLPILHRSLLGLVIASILMLSRIVSGEPNDDDITPEAPPTIQTLSVDRGGQELIGQPWPELDLVRLEHDDSSPRDTDPNAKAVTIYRWWTNGCPYCKSSLPAIEEWRAHYEAEGLRTVAVYHPKPPRDISDAFVRRAAEAIGYHGELAIDADWSQLNRVTRGWDDRRATSVSFLVDHEGIIRFVHPGPDFFPSDDSQHARQNRDHALLAGAIESLLVELATARDK